MNREKPNWTNCANPLVSKRKLFQNSNLTIFSGNNKPNLMQFLMNM